MKKYKYMKNFESEFFKNMENEDKILDGIVYNKIKKDLYIVWLENQLSIFIKDLHIKSLNDEIKRLRTRSKS